MYKINLNKDVNIDFRDTVNNYIDFSINKTYHNDDKENAWNSICAIMDRIDDLVIYLNDKELNNGKWNRCAFDFFEFIEQASVLVECIDEVFKIYGIEAPRTKVIFKHKKINQNYIDNSRKNNKKVRIEDKDYFDYIRALSSVHPSKTNRHKEFQLANLEVSPYVVWNGGIYKLDPRCNGELVLVTYNNETNDFLTNKSLYINEIFNFIKYKYYSLNYLTKQVKKINELNIKKLRNTKIKKVCEFSTYNDYLNNLIEESKIRCPNITDDICEVYTILNTNIYNAVNKKKLNNYCNALKIGITTIHRQLQNMDYEGNSISDKLLQTLLLGQIYDKNNYSYLISKILYLKDDYPGEKHYGLICYKELLPIFSKYIDIKENDLIEYTYNELYVLSQVAIYYHELENNIFLNKIIPNTNKYR